MKKKKKLHHKNHKKLHYEKKKSKNLHHKNHKKLHYEKKIKKFTS